ncbi:MAG TPA: hypothetical protein VJM46_02370 [Candidatus Saccharimonadales bacterium]|nr:hypothetical protein [Candidatus Saccharimonadales bacterium]
MAKSLRDRIWDASRGVLEPSARQHVRPAIYDELKMSPGVGGVYFDNVVILVGFTIRNSSATGTIIVPVGTTTIDLGGSLVNVRYWSWGKIGEEFDV